MYRRRLLFVLACTATLQPQLTAQEPGVDLVGHWEGALDAGIATLRIVFHFERDGDGWKATMDSPDQGATGIQVTKVTLDGKALRLEVDSVRGHYTGTLDDQGERCTGNWSQGIALELDLKRVAEPSKPARPQEPKPPFPYAIHEVEYSYDPAQGPQASLEPRAATGKKRLTLAGTLTVPHGDGPHPAALLITGSGVQDRDETIFGHKPFWVLADCLSRRGLAVLRVDDRGVGKSTGSAATATSEDFAEDVRAGIAFLHTRRADIDPRRIGLIGHSEGGLIAPLVAADNGDVAFVVLLAGPGLPGTEIIKLQEQLIGKASGRSQSRLAADAAFRDRLNQALTTADAPDPAVLRAILEQAVENLTPFEVQAIGDPQAHIDRQIAIVTSPWYRFFLRHDPIPSLERVRCPVLALNGAKDLQVDAKQNLPPIRAALARADNQDVTIEELPKLNHLFQTAITGGLQEYAVLQETFAPVALEQIANWLVQRFVDKR
jgi:pimeloyl-ACP methyl ester carboxylesterase